MPSLLYVYLPMAMSDWFFVVRLGPSSCSEIKTIARGCNVLSNPDQSISLKFETEWLENQDV